MALPNASNLNTNNFNLDTDWPRFSDRFAKLQSHISSHDVWLLAGSLAYTTALALAPFFLIMLSIAALLGPELQENLYKSMTSALGSQAGAAVELVVSNAEKSKGVSSLSGLLGLVILAISASAIFSQLRVALDRLNEWKGTDEQSGIRAFVKDKFLSVGLVFGFIFLSIVSLFITTAIALVLEGGNGAFWQAISSVINYVIFAFLFAAMYRFIPTKGLRWRRCLISGAVSALFYLLGKTLIGLYLGTAGLGTPYGAAGSLIVFLVWVYYTALMLLISYEFTNDVLLPTLKDRIMDRGTQAI